MSRKLEKSRHDVWLAGLGALAVAEQEGSDLFQSLVKKGAEVERRMTSAGWLKSPWRQEVRELEADRLWPSGGTAPFDVDNVAHRQALRLDRARKEFLQEFGNPATDVRREALNRWKREGKIFVVTHRDEVHLPNFQFDERGRPRPAVARVIQLLGGTTSEWGLALWFAANNGWLGGKRPVDLLASAPEKVVEAAEREAEELVF